MGRHASTAVISHTRHKRTILRAMVSDFQVWRYKFSCLFFLFLIHGGLFG